MDGLQQRRGAGEDPGGRHTVRKPSHGHGTHLRRNLRQETCSNQSVGQQHRVSLSNELLSPT